MNTHKNKHIRAAVDYALSNGWRLVFAGSRAHAWGRMYRPRGDRSGCQFSVFSTPRNPQGHAEWIRRCVDARTHSHSE